MSARRVVLASANRGKLAELAALLAPLGFDLTPQAALGIASPAEPGATFVANALIKARHATAASALPAIADDSGIEVDALAGAPGVRSARYAGERASDQENLQKLLQELRSVPAAQRSARYRCAIVFVDDAAADRVPIIAEGVWHGQIALQARGTRGFGYDPIFIPAGLTCTAAQLPAAQKNALSHRAAALRELVQQLSAAA